MRKILQSLMLAACVAVTQLASAATVVVNANITTNTSWTNDNVYVLSGEILVKGATLSIQAGTLIKGQAGQQSRLVITPGAKINAKGTATQPIVFTSSKAAGQRVRGDWAGILVLGKAPINAKDANGNSIQKLAECYTVGLENDYSYGGSDANDSSGVISYVRIEYAGLICNSTVELNSLTLAGVGAKTIISHVMVSKGLDDGFEMFGGTVNLDHVISFSSRDDDFDTDWGWSGKAQHGLIVRDTVVDQGDRSNAFESDNSDNATSNLQPYTSGVISNFTIIGPAATTTTTTDPKLGWGARLRRNTHQSIFNTVIIGYSRGLFIEDSLTQLNAGNNTGVEFKNNVLAGMTQQFHEKTFDSLYIANPANAIKTYTGNANDSVKLNYAYGDLDLYNFTPQAGSPLLAGGDFTNPKLATGFTSTTHRGAFGTDNWAACWSEFTPNDEVYNGAINYGYAVTVSQTGNLPSASLNATVPAGTYTYNWSTGGTTQAITVTTEGTYTVTVTNPRGCAVTASIAAQVSGVEIVKSNINSISLFPNPTQGNTTLEISLAEAAAITLTVTDMTGKVMMNKAEQMSIGINWANINTADYASGIYFVNIKNGMENQTIRLVVSK